jgi:formate dehydrogenase major subunit
MAKPKLTLNGRAVKFEPGQTILEVARAAGVEIPTLCWLADATPTGACRMCVVEVKGARNLVAACAAPAAEGMEVSTDTDQVHAARRLNVELLLASGDHNCLVCEANGDCRLQELAYRYGVDSVRFAGKTQHYPTEDANPLIVRDFDKCVLCGRCVQACNEVQVNRAIGFGYRGADAKIVTTGDRPYHESDCVFCGQCVEACPVGALVEKKAVGKARTWETQKVRTTCPYCGVGCQTWLHVKDGEIVKVTAVDDGPPNFGRLCVKGRFGYDFQASPERLASPLVRKDGELVEASWQEALDLVAQKLGQIKAQSGPDAVAGLASARAANEANYLFQKLLRKEVGTNNVDHCARL